MANEQQNPQRNPQQQQNNPQQGGQNKPGQQQQGGQGKPGRANSIRAARTSPGRAGKADKAASTAA